MNARVCVCTSTSTAGTEFTIQTVTKWRMINNSVFHFSFCLSSLVHCFCRFCCLSFHMHRFHLHSFSHSVHSLLFSTSTRCSFGFYFNASHSFNNINWRIELICFSFVSSLWQLNNSYHAYNSSLNYAIVFSAFWHLATDQLDIVKRTLQSFSFSLVLLHFYSVGNVKKIENHVWLMTKWMSWEPEKCKSDELCFCRAFDKRKQKKRRKKSQPKKWNQKLKWENGMSDDAEDNVTMLFTFR